MAIEDLLWKLTAPSLVVGAIFALLFVIGCIKLLHIRHHFTIGIFAAIGFVLGVAIGSMPFLASLSP